MRRAILIVPVAAALAAFVWAEGPGPEAPAGDAVRRFRRDQELIATLVEGGIELANEEDPLRRAAECNKLADRVAGEIRRAGAIRDSARVAELGPHLQALLENGVAGNLAVARTQIARGSAGERKLLEFSKVVQRMEEDLGRVPGPAARSMGPALSAVRQGRARVEKAIQGPGNPGRETRKDSPEP
jgi:hypothetical protein